MYTEDVEWCMRAHRAGYNVAEFGAFSVIHHGHASGSQFSALKNEMIHLPKVIKAHNRYSGLTMVMFSLGRRFRWLLFARILFNERRAAVYA